MGIGEEASMCYSDYELYWAEAGCNEQEMMWAMQEQEADIKKEDDSNDII